MSKLFNIKNKDEDEELKYINDIRNAASQITLGKIDDYKIAIEKYLEFVRSQIQVYLGAEYYVITVYYSLLIEDLTKKRITVEDPNEKPYIKQLKKWYDNKFNKFEAFSLVPESLEKHSDDKRPPKYLVKFKKNGNSSGNVEVGGDIKEISLYCYEKEDSLLNTLFKEVNGNISDKSELNTIFDRILEQLVRNKDNLLKLFGDAQCLDSIKNCIKMNNGKEVTTEQLLPFIMLWYPIHNQWPCQYYIPSPIYSNTPIGGLVIGTGRLLNPDEIDNLEDIALKVSVDISFIEHKEKVMQQSRRTAVSAVMGRNMSHNIGSHVLWHLAQDIKLDSSIKGFFDYIRERMGFVGLISTTSPSWVLEYELSKVIDTFNGQKLLLQNLVKTEKEGLEIKIVPNINVFKRDVALPHGSYGAHSFFTILENIIRNTVKHNVQHVGEEVLFTISLEESEIYKDYLKLKITDNLTQYGREGLDKLVNDLKTMPEEKIIDDDGKLINKHLGFKEKRICAAFLRLIPQEAVDCSFDPPLLRVEKNGNHLAHIIYLKKPKKALLVTKNPDILNRKDEFQKKGIYIKEYKEDDDKNILSDIDDFTHEFLIIDGNINSKTEEFCAKNRPKLPFRILTKNDFNNESISSEPDECYFFVWEKWFTRYFNNDDRKEKKIMLINNDSPQTTLNGFKCKDKIDIVRGKKVDDDVIPDNNIVLSHDITITTTKDIFKNSYYVEAFAGEGSDGLFTIIHDMFSSSPFLLYKLLESILFKVAIIDERIFKERNEEISIEPSAKYEVKKVILDQLWGKRQVKIINHDEIIEKNNWKFIDTFKPDVFIIHQGVIDKYRNRYGTESINEVAMKIKEKVNYVIIDSDRGKPNSEDLKMFGARWLQFSDLSSIMINKAHMNVAKYILINLITTLREY